MPNIELHGYTCADAVNVRDRIRKVLKASTSADEIVTTIILSDVEDLKGVKMPFLRVISSLNELDDLKKYLKSLGEDMEILVLDEWVPKEKPN